MQNFNAIKSFEELKLQFEGVATTWFIDLDEIDNPVNYLIHLIVTFRDNHKIQTPLSLLCQYFGHSSPLFIEKRNYMIEYQATLQNSLDNCKNAVDDNDKDSNNDKDNDSDDDNEDIVVYNTDSRCLDVPAETEWRSLLTEISKLDSVVVMSLGFDEESANECLKRQTKDGLCAMYAYLDLQYMQKNHLKWRDFAYSHCTHIDTFSASSFEKENDNSSLSISMYSINSLPQELQQNDDDVISNVK